MTLETPHPNAPDSDLTSPLDEAIPAELPRREPLVGAALREHVSRVRDGERTRAEVEAERVDAILEEALASIHARAADMGERRKSLPCYPDMEAGRVAAGADACYQARARKGCPFATSSEWCAVSRDEALYRQAAERLDASRALKLEGDLCAEFIETIPGRRGPGGERLPVVEVLPTRAMIYVSAFIEQTQAIAGEERVNMAGKKLLVISGANGRGKTWAAVAALAREGGMMLKAPELEEEAGASKEKRLGVSALLDSARRAAFLNIDEAGFEKPGYEGACWAMISGLICERYSKGLYTLVTTNLQRHRPEKAGDNFPPQFLERYGRRVDDRLNERGEFLVVKGESLRGRARRADGAR